MSDMHNQFEILGLIHSNRETLKRLTHVLFVIIFILLGALVYLAKKPPLVIRIDKVGNTDVLANYTIETAIPSDDDIKNFTKRFLDDYVGLKSNLIVRQFETTLNMMTPELAKEHLKAMKEQNTVGIVQAAGIRNDVTIAKLNSEVTGDEVYVKVHAFIATRPMDDQTSPAKSKSIVASMVLTKTARTSEHPFALLVSEIQVQADSKGAKIENNLGEVIDDATTK